MSRKPNTFAANVAVLHDAGKLAAQAGRAVEEANKGRASALDLMISGLCGTGVMSHVIAFDVIDRAGAVVEHCKESFASYLRGFKNADGTDYRAKQTAFRSVALPVFFGVDGDQSAGSKAVWSLVLGKALPAASALLAEGMTAAIKDGKLVVSGGTGDKADALRAAAAKSTSALATAAKPAKGTPGTQREAAQNDDGQPSPSEICAAAVRVARKVAKGEEALCGAALSCLREIAKLIASHPEAFADE